MRTSGNPAILAIILLFVIARPFAVFGEDTPSCNVRFPNPLFTKELNDFLDEFSVKTERSVEPATPSCEQPSVCSKAGCVADLKTKIDSWKKKGTNYCVGQMQKFYCTHSPWRNCGRDQKYRVFIERAEKILKQRQQGAVDRESSISASREVSQIPLNILPCLAGAETVNLEPLALPTLGCHANSERKSDAFGIGQVLSSALKFMTDDDLAYKFVSNIEPYNQPPYTFEKKGRLRSNAKKLYAVMGESVDLQLEMMIELLAQKYRRSMNKNARGKAKLFGAVRDYNGSATKVRYAEAVLRCKSCLDQGKEPWLCLEKIRPNLGKLTSCVEDPK